MKKILLVEGNLREANQEFTDNGIKTHTESLKESIDYFTNDLEIVNESDLLSKLIETSASRDKPIIVKNNQNRNCFPSL